MGDLIGTWFDRDVVRVWGADAARFLQGQVSQDVEGLAVGASAWSLLLDPSGKLVVWFRATRTADDTFLLDMSAGWAEAAMARLNRFRIRVACEIEELEGWRMFAVRAPGAPGGAAAAGTAVEPDDALRSAPGTIVAPAAGASIGVAGYDLLGTDPVQPDGVRVDADEIEALRVAAGIPESGAELDDTVIPAEIGAWFVEEAVSWTKGCYTGQELVARLDSRGSNTPRRLRSVTLDGPASPGDEVLVDGAVVGTLTSVFGTTALARIGRSIEPPAAATVGGSAATITEIAGSTPPPAVVADVAPRRRSLI